MGIKMRFVPDVNQLMNFSTRGKSAQLAARQLAFEDKMGYANSWEVADLYSKDKRHNQCLADMITTIPSQQIPHLNIFHSVSPGFKTGTTTFAFIPQLESEARTMVSALLPYLRAKYGDYVFKFFTPSAADRAQECEWDPETNQVISPQDTAVVEATTLDSEYHFEPSDIDFDLPLTAPAPTGGTAAFAKDSDSISTFRDIRASAPKKKTASVEGSPVSASGAPGIPQKVTPTSRRRNGSTDDTSRTSPASSVLTMETLDTRIQESLHKALAGDLSNMISQAVAQSMQIHMQQLAISHSNQAETFPRSSMGTSGQVQQPPSNDDSTRGSPIGAAADG